MNQDNNESYHTPYNVDIYHLSNQDSIIRYIEHVLSLPESAINILFDPGVADLVEENFGPRFNLTPEQKQELTRVIRDILLADLYFKKIPETIQKKLQINETTAKDITKELLGTVLSSAWEDVKTIHDAKFGREENLPKPTLETPAVQNPEPPVANPNNVLDLRDKNKQN